MDKVIGDGYGLRDTWDFGMTRMAAVSRSRGGLSERDVAYYAGASSQIQQRNDAMAAHWQRAELEKPLPPVHDPLVEVRVLQAFRAGTPIRVVEVGEVVKLPTTLAQSLAGLGRCEIVS